MSLLSKEEKVKIFISLFRGRDDVFAQRWEKWDGSISGYSPVAVPKNYGDKCFCDRTKKFKCNYCEERGYLKLTDTIIEDHLTGKRTIGIYPLLLDNSSYFVAADFDGDYWLESAEELLKECKEYDIPSYVERSRSGKGGHVWWFFEANYPAYKSRKVFLSILKEAGIIGEFDKEDSFDRLFPNQDYLSKKGFGNLIALPLQGHVRKLGNTVFLNPENRFEPYENQWDFLHSVNKISTTRLDTLFNHFNQRKQTISPKKNVKEIPIIIAEQIFIPKEKLTKDLSHFLTENLNFVNSEFLIKRKMGLSTFGIEKYFKTISHDDHNVFIPRGFHDELIRYLNENRIPFSIEDRRQKFEQVNFTTTFHLFDYQKAVVNACDDKDHGVLVAPPGSGKTVMGLALVARKAQPTLIIVHRREIYNQWIERIRHFLQIPKQEIGQFASNKKFLRFPITIAMIQTLIKMERLDELPSTFGLVIVDECHHIPARMFRQVITRFNPRYLYGLTATPQRKHNDEKLIFVYLGNIIYEVPRNYSQIKGEAPATLEVVIRDTNFTFPFSIKNDDFPLFSRMLIFDSSRNLLIADDIAQKAREGCKCLVLTERKEHVEVLNYYLRRDLEVITLTGDISDRKRKDTIKQIHSGHFQILIATGQLVGEGADFQNLDCLFLVYPFAFEGKLIQYMGRIQHGDGKIKTIYDYRDKNIDFLEKLFKRRQRYYKKY